MQNRYMIITRDDRTLSSLSRWTQEDKRTIKLALFIIFLQMTREEKLETIYIAIANKDRTFGCKYIVKNEEEGKLKVRETEWECIDLTYWDEHREDYWYDESQTHHLVSVIWHPVMIGDVIDWIEKKEFDIHKPIPWFWFEEDEEFDDETKLLLIQDYYIDNVISYWNKKREAIESQSDECIDYIYSLTGK